MTVNLGALAFRASLWNQFQCEMLHCGRFVNSTLPIATAREESMSKPLSLSAHISTALMAVFVFAVAVSGPDVELPSDRAGATPLVGLTIGR